MRWNSIVRHTLVLTLAAGLAACGDSSTDPDNEGDELTEAEAEVMVEALAEAGGFFVGSFGSAGGPASSGPAAAPQDFPIDDNPSCPEGGSIDLDGNGTVDDETGFLSWTITQTHQSCVVTASDGSTWTFNGNPNITLDFEMTFSENSFTADGTQEGGVSWSQGSKSGSCSIDLTYAFSGSEDGTSFSGSVNGSVCGHAVSETVDQSG